jgi:diguanylate cyclase (GGDEF)-like protein
MSAKPKPSLSRLILGTSKAQRQRLEQCLLACAAYFTFLILHVFEVRAGLMDARLFSWLLGFCLLGMAGFSLTIRTGLNLHIGKDPVLMMPQQIFAIVAVVWTYAIAGPDRGATLSILVLILVFGAFRFRTKDMVKLSVFALALLGGVMFWQCRMNPARYPTDLAIYQFFYAALSIWPLCVLTAWTSQMQKALASQKAALNDALEKIKRQAESDELTGLVNRRAAMPMLKSEMAARQREPGQICIALIDIDRFKAINDKFGHQTGDEALRLFAHIGKTTLRAGDMFARWGGEEFLLMLPDSTIAQGVECIERIRAALAATPFDCVCPGFKMTLSAGVTNLRLQDTLESALERADQAMYQAKQMGRDRIIVGGNESDCSYARQS